MKRLPRSNPLLKLELKPSASHSRVELDGKDISGFIRRIEVRCAAGYGEVSTAVLEYIGAITVEGEPGRTTLTQGEHLTTCDTCKAVLRGQRLADVNLDAIGEPVEPIPLPVE